MDTFPDKNKINENTPTSSHHATRNYSKTSEFSSNFSDRDKNEGASNDDLKDADDFLNDMDDFDNMIRNSPRLVSRRLRLTKIDESKSKDKKLDKLDVVKDVTHTDKRESDSVENTAEKSKCIANTYSRYRDDDEIDSIVDELINDDYSSVKCSEKSRSRSKQNKTANQKRKGNSGYNCKEGSDLTMKATTTKHAACSVENDVELRNDLDENIKVVDYFEPERTTKKVKAKIHSEFSDINFADYEKDTTIHEDYDKHVERNVTVKMEGKSRSRSKNRRHTKDKYEYAESDEFNIDPVTNGPSEIEIEVNGNKDDDNTSVPESYFQHNVIESRKKTRGTEVVGSKGAKKTESNDRDNFDLIQVLQEIKSDKNQYNDSKTDCKDTDIVTKLGSVVIRVQSEHQITTGKDGYDETLPGAVPKNARKTIVKSVTIIDTGDAGIVIIKKLKRRSRIREMFCGCFGSDSGDTEFDFGEHTDENIECSDGNSKGNAGNYFNNDVLHFEVNIEGCLRRLWNRLRGRV